MAASRDDGSDLPVVIARRSEYQCPWFEVVVKDVRYPGQARVHSHYSVQLNDWTAVLAVDAERKIPLVRQYRPALERMELELPAGAVRDASPEETARFELLEETGYEADELVLLGSIFAESGRLTSRAWVYFAPHARRVAEPAPPAEEPLECVVVTQTELRAAIASGAFGVSGHVAAVGLAFIHGLLALPPA
jgi:ADP-ribose pyrophosphatase